MYGENSGAIRAELAALLRHHRIQHRLGGPIGATAQTSTTAEREAMGRQIRHYRQCVLVWCRQAVTATTRDAFDGAIRDRDRDVAEEFRHRLHTAVAASRDRLANLDEITAPVGNALVDTWRRAARAASLGEHDFAAGIDYAHLTNAQCATVIQDAAAVVRAVVSLDHRYRNIPGWDGLASPGRLLYAAEDCTLLHVEYEPDYSVDLGGWHPRPRSIPGQLRPGLAGVIQGTRNLLVGLDEVPNIHNFRVVLESQRIVSAATARASNTTDAAVASLWHHRAQTFQSLVARTRDVAGNLGDGRAAARHATVLARHIRDLEPDLRARQGEARTLDALFAQIDNRLADLFETGARHKVYFLRVQLSHLDTTRAGLVKHREEAFVPLTTPMGRELVTKFEATLRRPTPPSAASRTPSTTTRTGLGAALRHSTDARSDAIGL